MYNVCNDRIYNIIVFILLTQPGYAGPAGSHIGQQGRSVTWHAFNKDNASELSRQAIKSEPTRIRPTYPFPSLHLVQVQVYFMSSPLTFDGRNV